MQPRVSSAAGPAPATGTAQAGAADSALMQRGEGSGAASSAEKRLALILCFKPRDNPTPPSILTSGNKSSFMDGPPLPPFPLELRSLCLN